MDYTRLVVVSPPVAVYPLNVNFRLNMALRVPATDTYSTFIGNTYVTCHTVTQIW